MVVGKFVGEQALAAVGASYAITNVFIAIAIGGGIGSSVVISQFLGAGKLAKMKTAVYTTMFNFLGIAAFLAAVGLLLQQSDPGSRQRTGGYFLGRGAVSRDLLSRTAVSVHV